MKNVLISVLMLAYGLIPATAQTVEPTTVAAHRMGETLDPWLAVAGHCGDLPAYSFDCYDVDSVRKSGSGQITEYKNNHKYYWTFDHSLCSDVIVQPWGEPEPPQVDLGLLIQKYGKPTTNEVVERQNSYGAKWTGVNAEWKMPDGTFILAYDDMNRGAQVLVVTFTSKAAMEKKELERKNRPSAF